MYVIAAAALVLVSSGPAHAAVALGLFVIAMLALGMGNGAVFQLVPQRFRQEIGVMTGLVGMAGGVGGRSEERRVGKSVSVRVDLGGRRIIKTKKSKEMIKKIQPERSY